MLKESNKGDISNSKAAKQLGLMIFLTIVTQAIMLIKTSIVASKFGATIEMDAFNFSNSIGTFIYSFIGSGITTVLIPTLIKSDEDNREAVNIFISVLYSIAFLIMIIVQIFRGALVNGLSSGNEQFVTLACNIMFITLVSQFIQSITGATNAIFQCSGKFNFPKFINLALSIILVVLLIFTKNLTIAIYAFYILITTVINIGVQIFLAIKGGYKFKFKIDFKNDEFRRMMKIFAPTVLSSGLYQVSLLTDSIISSNLGTGEISKLSYSNNIMGLINTVVSANIMTYFYPKVAKTINEKNGQKNIFDLSILINSIMILMVTGFFIVGREGITLLYERGKFTPAITTVVYTCTLIYIIGLPINSFRDLIYRYFYAKGDTITPFKNSLIVSILNIVVSIILAKFMGIYGVIIGTVFTSYISLTMIIIRFDKKFKFEYSKKRLIVENCKLIFAAVFTIFIVKGIRLIIPNFNILITFILYGGISVAIYVYIMYILKSGVFKVKINDL